MRNLLASEDLQGRRVQIMTVEEFHPRVCTWTAITQCGFCHSFYVGKSHNFARRPGIGILGIIGSPSIRISVERLSNGL